MRDMTQTIGQLIKWDFEANGLLEIKNKNGRTIYIEDSDGDWTKREYDSQGRQNYIEDSDGTWRKWELDSEGKVIYYENSNGKIVDKRPKPCENKEIVIEGVKYKLTKV
jgi:hypothetical protein